MQQAHRLTVRWKGYDSARVVAQDCPPSRRIARRPRRERKSKAGWSRPEIRAAWWFEFLVHLRGPTHVVKIPKWVEDRHREAWDYQRWLFTRTRGLTRGGV